MVPVFIARYYIVLAESKTSRTAFLSEDDNTHAPVHCLSVGVVYAFKVISTIRDFN